MQLSRVCRASFWHQRSGYLALYALPCAHNFRVRETTRFICAHRTSSPDLSAQKCISLLRAVTRHFISMVRTIDLRLAKCPLARLCACAGRQCKNVGTCPMIEATYHRHHRRPMRIDESVVRSKMHVGLMCVCCAAVGHRQPRICLVMNLFTEVIDRHALAQLHMSTLTSDRRPRYICFVD
jgi:hypothetical protein